MKTFLLSDVKSGHHLQQLWPRTCSCPDTGDNSHVGQRVRLCRETIKNGGNKEDRTGSGDQAHDFVRSIVTGPIIQAAPFILLSAYFSIAPLTLSSPACSLISFHSPAGLPLQHFEPSFFYPNWFIHNFLIAHQLVWLTRFHGFVSAKFACQVCVILSMPYPFFLIILFDKVLNKISCLNKYFHM